MSKVIVIGSGASGVHFALSALEKGHEVTMLDVGNSAPPSASVEGTFVDLKANLDDPVRYFLGSSYEAMVHPGSKGEYYGFPPHKSYVFSRPSSFGFETEGFEPLVSFARGGLAESWTGGVYPLNEQELQDFPFGYTDIEPYYSEVARRIGISGLEDDLSRFYPVHDNLIEPLRLDKHSERLLGAYERDKTYLNQKLNFYMGRSRVAALSQDMNGRKGCTYTGRCLWGCPSGAFYTPSLTLNECQRFPNFVYVPNMNVSHFTFGSHNHIKSVVAESLNGHAVHEIRADKFVLAAGTLSSSKIFMDSVQRATGRIVRLTGLMDNRQILIPFVNLGMIGKNYDDRSYQYHQIAMGIESEQPNEYFHALVTTLKTALVHPIIQSIPLDLRTSLSLFRNLRAGLGVVNLNFRDTRRDCNFVTLKASNGSTRSKLIISYSPIENERRLLKRTVKTVKRALWRMGCIVPPGMTHIRPMGASVHYAGTIPMSTESLPLTASRYCQSHDYENLYFVDGTTFPALPAKNLTFTLMANAMRVADAL